MPRGGYFLVSLSGTPGDASVLRYTALVTQLNCRARCQAPSEDRPRLRTGNRVLSTSRPSPHQASNAEDGIFAGKGQVENPPGNEVRFVQVLSSSSDPDSASEHRRTLQQLRRTVGTHFQTVAENLSWQYDVLRGPPDRRLLECAREQECDLILANQPATAAQRRALVRRLVLEAPCSVWLVPEGAPATIRRILVPVDFSERSADALHVAVALARPSGATCYPLHIYFNDAVVGTPEYDQVLRQQKEQTYQELTADLDCSGVTVELLLVEGAKISHVISRVAQKHEVDLIVMTTRGRSRAAAFLFGSVTEQMLMRSRVPLLVVKQPGTMVGFFGALVDNTFRQKDDTRFN